MWITASAAERRMHDGSLAAMGALMTLLTLAVFLALGATVWSLLSGVSAMATDGAVAKHDSEGWMIRRMAFQAAALALVLIAVLS
jgi:hypothetical protein